MRMAIRMHYQTKFHILTQELSGLMYSAIKGARFSNPNPIFIGSSDMQSRMNAIVYRTA